MRQKKYRVTQYQTLSDFGLVLLGDGSRLTSNEPEENGSKDFRYLWRARLCAWINRGESAGLGLRTLTTKITRLDTGEEVR